MIRDYALWSAAVAAGAGLATVVILRLWDRQVRREEREALALVRDREAAAGAAAAAAAANARRNRALAEAWAIVLWRVGWDGGLLDAQGWTALTGQPLAEARGDGWRAMIHPEDRDRVGAAWAAAMAEGAPLDVENRVRTAAGDWRWCRARGVPVREDGSGEAGSGEAGRPAEWAGMLEDVDERRRAEERRLLVAREVDHRAKNVLAVVGTIIRLSRAETPEAFTRVVNARVAALARAHDLLAEGGWEGADLGAVAERELAPWMREGAVALDGPVLPLAPVAVQPVGMVLHELATNAAKCGALSRPGGRLSLSWRAEGGLLHLRWVESGGPSLRAPPERQGFGARMVDATVRRQLAGTIERRWTGEGLTVEIALPLDRVAATARAAA